MTWLLLAAVLGHASEQGGSAPPVEASLHGDVKTFFFGVFPYESALLPEQPLGEGIASGRLKLEASWGDTLVFTAHHDLSAVSTGGGFGLPGFSSGIAAGVPQAVDLDWQGWQDSEDITVRGRTDRLSLRGRFGPVDVTLGRQPISFGAGSLFTPIDLVGPFNPSVIDQEYKPGYDALRVDGYVGMTGLVTGVIAYGGAEPLGSIEDPGLETVLAAGYGQATVGVTDLGLFVGEIRADEVIGASVKSSVGTVGLHGDAAVTVSDDDDTFFRGVAGALYRPTTTTTLTGEVYVQTLGADDPSGYLQFAQHPRVVRGELWLLGRYYAGLAVDQEITPLVHVAGAVVGNLTDPSAFVAPSLSWSVAGNASIHAGAFFGLGERPEGLTLHSEFGLYPASVFLQTRAYF